MEDTSFIEPQDTIMEDTAKTGEELEYQKD